MKLLIGGKSRNIYMRKDGSAYYKSGGQQVDVTYMFKKNGGGLKKQYIGEVNQNTLSEVERKKRSKRKNKLFLGGNIEFSSIKVESEDLRVKDGGKLRDFIFDDITTRKENFETACRAIIKLCQMCLNLHHEIYNNKDSLSEENSHLVSDSDKIKIINQDKEIIPLTVLCVILKTFEYFRDNEDPTDLLGLVNSALSKTAAGEIIKEAIKKAVSEANPKINIDNIVEQYFDINTDAKTYNYNGKNTYKDMVEFYSSIIHSFYRHSETREEANIDIDNKKKYFVLFINYVYRILFEELKIGEVEYTDPEMLAMQSQIKADDD
jgi:hypothetical protein